MSQLSDVRIAIGGQRQAMFSRVSITQWIDRHHTFEVSLPTAQVEGEEGMKVNKAKEFIGKEIDITITYRQGSGRSFEFKGFITQLFLAKGASYGSSVVVRGFSASILLEEGSRYAAFYKKGHKAIVNKILEEYNASLLRPEINPKNDQEEDYIVKFDESSYNFLHRFAAATGNWFFYDGSRTVFGDVKNETPIELKYGQDIMALDMRMDLPSGKFFMDDWNYRKAEQIKSHSGDVNVSGLGEYGQFLIDQGEKLYPERKFGLPPIPVFSTSEVKKQVEHEKKAMVANAVVVSGSSSVIGLKVGSVIDIKEHSTKPGKKTENFGQYRITNISHEADLGGGYSNRFEAIPVGVEFRVNPTFYVPRATPQIARVTDNNDPDQLGRIRVNFLWQSAQGDTESSTWIRVLTPYIGGPDKSYFFMPEVETVVTTLFENDDPARPIAVGNVFHHKLEQKPWTNKDNNFKVIATRGDNHIVINDEEGKEEISLYNYQKQNHIQLSLDGTHISIKSQGTINLNAGTINMKAKKISMEAEEEWKVQAKTAEVTTDETITLDATEDIELDSGTSIKVTATESVDVSGQDVSVDSQMQTSVTAGSKLELDGGPMTTLKGGMVMIN